MTAGSPAPGLCHGQFAPVLVVDQLSQEGSDDAFDCLSWGGGPAGLLAAATANHLYIFSLRNFLLKQAALYTLMQPQSGGPDPSPTLPLPSNEFHLAHRSALGHSLLSIAWTHGAHGLLLTDSGHQVLMLKLTVHGLESVHVARGGYPGGLIAASLG